MTAGLPRIDLSSRETLTMEVARRLLDYFLSGEVEPGGRIPSERRLAESLGVGRSLVREALKSLHLLGLLEVRQGDGTYLKRTDSELLPQVIEWGLLLGEKRLATAMIDLSDGLSSDLAHLCRESGVGALIDASRIPVDPLVTDLCGRRALDPLLLALHGGEDFELLFTVRPRDLGWLPRTLGGVPVTYIGDVTSESGRFRISEGSRIWTLEPAGFMHFGR